MTSEAEKLNATSPAEAAAALAWRDNQNAISTRRMAIGQSLAGNPTKAADIYRHWEPLSPDGTELGAPAARRDPE